MWELADGAANEVLACKHKDRSSIPRDEAWMCTLLILALGRGKQEDSWYLLPNQTTSNAAVIDLIS